MSTDATTRSTASIHAAADVVALTKPRITMMAVLTAAGALMLAPGSLSFFDSLLSLLGIGLLVSGAGALNMFIERDVDGLMVRTRNRPLPAGRLAPPSGVLTGALLCAVAIPLIAHSANALTALLGAFSLFVYVLVYTPMKRTSAWAMIIGAVPGAMPALMGYTARANAIDAVALAIFGVLFFWQIPHFLAISIYRSREYRDAGYVVFPHGNNHRLARVGIVVGAVFLVLTTGLVHVLDVGGLVYLVSAGLLGAHFLWVSAGALVDKKVERRARRVFVATLIYQTLLFAALAADVALQTFFS
jgi:protoheme IX farnesyltransferase